MNDKNSFLIPALIFAVAVSIFGGFLAVRAQTTGWLRSASQGNPTLQTEGSAKIGVINPGGGLSVGFGAATSSDGAIITTGGAILNTAGAPTGLIVASGNVGIGTNNPQKKLDIPTGDLRIGGTLEQRYVIGVNTGIGGGSKLPRCSCDTGAGSQCPQTWTTTDPVGSVCYDWFYAANGDYAGDYTVYMAPVDPVAYVNSDDLKGVMFGGAYSRNGSGLYAQNIKASGNVIAGNYVIGANGQFTTLTVGSCTGCGGGASGVASINGNTGAMTFNGAGVTQSGNTFTFSGTGSGWAGSGSGTTGRLVRWAGPTTLGDSIIQDNGSTAVGILTAPNGLYKLSVGSLSSGNVNGAAIIGVDSLGKGVYGWTGGTDANLSAGVYGVSGSANAPAVQGYNSTGGLAGKFEGNVSITGNLTVNGSGGFSYVGSCDAISGNCKCNAGERIMLLQSYGFSAAGSSLCRVMNQNSSSVYGMVENSNVRLCEFACFR